MGYSGTASIHFNGQQRSCSIVLEPEEERIVTKFPLYENEGFELLGKKKIFEKRFQLTDVNIPLPFGLISECTLRNLLLTEISPGTMSIYDSPLVRALTLHKTEIGICTLTFTPRKSLIRLPIEGLPDAPESELIFHDNRFITKRHLVSKIGRHNIFFTGDRSILIIRSKKNLLIEADKIRRALALLQGGQPLYRAGFYKKTLELNFIRRGVIRPLGLIFDDETLINEFFNKYIAYEKRLRGADSKRHQLAIEYIIEGSAGTAPLENKVISFYTALEIMDGSKTMNKNTIHSILPISLHESEFVIRIRNKLVHEGKMLSESILEAKNELNALKRLKRLPIKVLGVSKNTLASNYRFYLLDQMLKSIMEKIGMASVQSTYNEKYT